MSGWKGKSVAVGVVLVLAAVLGSQAGRFYASSTASHIGDKKARASTEYLLQNLKEIAVGLPFPEVVLLSLEDSRPQLAHELLPGGGLVIYMMADCESCLKTLSQLPSTLSRLSLAPTDVLIIIDGDPIEIERFVRDNELRERCFADLDSSLRTNYQVWSFPAMFRLDQSHRVTHLAANVVDADRLSEVLGY